MVIAPFGILAGLLLLGLLVAGVVLLIVLLRGKRLWWVLGIAGAVVAGLVVVGVVVGLWPVGVRSMRRVGYRESQTEGVAFEVAESP